MCFTHTPVTARSNRLVTDMSLRTDTLYIVSTPGSEDVLWARTPDGVGCYWYDEGDPDAYTDVEDYKRVRHCANMREFDSLRDY